MSVRINIILSFLLVACALSLITSQYKARSLFIQLERAQNFTRQFELQWTQFKLDQSTFGKHSRIETVANKELNMVPVAPNSTQYLTAKDMK